MLLVCWSGVYTPDTQDQHVCKCRNSSGFLGQLAIGNEILSDDMHFCRYRGDMATASRET